jgi:hypothetical protein
MKIPVRWSSYALWAAAGLALAWGSACIVSFVSSFVVKPSYPVAKEVAVLTTPPPGNTPKYSKSRSPIPVSNSDWEGAIAKQLGALKQGNIAFSVPDKMKTGERAVVTALIGSNVIPLDAVIKALPKRKDHLIQTAPTQISLKMKMILVGDEFTITPMTSEEQIVGGATPTEWEWSITPKESGTLHLHLTASVELEGTPRDLTTMDRDISVEVDLGNALENFASDNWKWIWTTLGGLVALFWRSRKSSKNE